jgi:RNA polymerase sigma factor (sigma-70 family)
MRRSLSNPTGSFLAPTDEKQPVILVEERDQPWYEGISPNQYDEYRQLAWNVALMIVGYPDEAEEVAGKTMYEIERRKHPPSKAEIGAHIRTLARHRAIDSYKSSKHKARMMLKSIVRKNNDDEEYEGIPGSCCTPGAENEVVAKEDLELLILRLKQGLTCLSDMQRICFVLHFVEGMEIKDIAKKLNVSASDASTAVYRAKKHIGKFLIQEKENGKCGKKERRSSQ